jgi:hypothetical protein
MSKDEDGLSPDPAPAGYITLAEHEEALEQEHKRFDSMQKILNDEIVRLTEAMQEGRSVPQSIELSAATKRAASKRVASPVKSGKKLVKAAKIEPPEDPDKPNRQHEKWNVKFEELVEYKKKYGHCNVPARDPEHKALATFVVDQRTMHRKLREGAPTSIFPERIRRLNALGFEWTVAKTKSLDFQTRLDQLQAYKRKHGHCNVPQKCSEFTGLGNFVLEQRRRYKLFLAGAKTSMNQERVDALNALGFEWKLRNMTAHNQSEEYNHHSV